MARVGIAIVAYNSGSEIGACLDAALRSGADLVVVDNASTDQTCDEVRRRDVRLIANSGNRGFAAAVNQAVSALDSPFVLVLNPDAVLLTPLDDLVEACMLPGAAGAGGMLLDPAGKPQIGFMVRRLPSVAALVFEALLLNRLWPGNRVNRSYRCLELDYTRRQPVEQPAGAMLMIRRDVWQALGGFDERYHPLWFEDVDFCKRAADCQRLLYYVPSAVAKHTGGHSLPALAPRQRQICWYGNLFRYTNGHFSAIQHRTVCVAVIAGAVMRMVIGCIARRSVEPCLVFGKVIALAARWFVSSRQASAPIKQDARIVR